MLTINVAQTLRSRVSGTVADSNGKLIAGAAILAEAANSTLKRVAVTNAFGEYQVDGLPPGEYRVTVSATNHLSVSYVVRLIQNSSPTIPVVLKRSVAATSASASQDKFSFSDGARASAFRFEPPTSVPATDAAPAATTKSCAKCKGAGCTISEKVKCLQPNFGARFLRALQYQYQIIEQPRTVLVGSTPTANPEHYLWQQTLTFKFAELFPDRFLILKRMNDYLKNDLNRITAERVNIGCLWDRAKTSELNQHLITCFSKGGNWIRRVAMGLSANVSLGERAAVQQGFLVTQPQFGKHSQFSGGFTFDPAKLVINASTWKSTFDDVAKIDPALAMLGADDAIAAMNNPSVRPPWQPQWEVVFIPKIEFQRKSQFDFLKSNGQLVEFQVPQRALNTLTLTWDLTRVIPDTKSRVDADAVMENLSNQVNGREAPKNTKFCIAMLGDHRRALAVSPLLPADSCWQLMKVAKVPVGDSSYPPDHYELACGSDEKSCNDDTAKDPKEKHAKDDKKKCSAGPPNSAGQQPNRASLPLNNSCRWIVQDSQAPYKAP